MDCSLINFYFLVYCYIYVISNKCQRNIKCETKIRKNAIRLCKNCLSKDLVYHKYALISVLTLLHY